MRGLFPQTFRILRFDYDLIMGSVRDVAIIERAMDESLSTTLQAEVTTFEVCETCKDFLRRGAVFRSVQYMQLVNGPGMSAFSQASFAEGPERRSTVSSVQRAVQWFSALVCFTLNFFHHFWPKRLSESCPKARTFKRCFG